VIEANLRPDGQSCNTCRFAGTHTHAPSPAHTLVRCLRFPPQRLGNQPPLGSSELTSQHRDTVWPILTVDDWCGEWAGRAKRSTECTYSPDGRHQVDTSMESGPNNCFHCEAPMGRP
jgi:hypothetical protein